MCRCCRSNERHITRLKSEGADLLAFHVHRVTTRTSAFLYLQPTRSSCLIGQKSQSARSRKWCCRMFGSGSFGLGKHSAPSPNGRTVSHLTELYSPNAGTSFGFSGPRLRRSEPFCSRLADEICSGGSGTPEGAWTLHPVKRLWDE